MALVPCLSCQQRLPSTSACWKSHPRMSYISKRRMVTTCPCKIDRRARSDSSMLSPDFGQNRTLSEDIKTLLCADGLVLARSSFSLLIVPHSRATKFFLPGPCGPGEFRYERNRHVQARVENTTQLMLERPGAEVSTIQTIRCQNALEDDDRSSVGFDLTILPCDEIPGS